MSYLLFLDESGHDHKNMPYEVHGGIVLRANTIWPFITDMRRLELQCFGTLLNSHDSEIKGAKLLKKDRFKWAAQQDEISDAERCTLARSFLEKGASGEKPTRSEFTAYGQACLKMGTGIFELLEKHSARLFAVTIPKGTPRPAGFQAAVYLRKDQVYLLERYYNFLSERDEHGLLVFDETERKNDARFLRAMEHYFAASANGKRRAKRVVPAPFFVASHMSYPVQAADIAIYCYNWAHRLPGMGGETRKEIAEHYGAHLDKLKCTGVNPETRHKYSGYCHVLDPYNTLKGNLPQK